MTMKTSLFVTTALASLVLSANGTPAFAAAPGTTGSDGIEEIVVTAEKRSENIQTAPAAITAVTGLTLVDQGITDTKDLEVLLPSASFKQSATSSMIFVRGVGNNVTAPAVDPGVSFNVNGVYTPREATGGGGILYDVSQIEVLPGPQGTLWGRNSAGGAINVITNQPTDKLEGSALLDVGAYAALHATAVLNVPVDDKLQARLALNEIRHDGYLSNGANDEDSQAARLTVAAQPIDNLKIVAYGSLSHDGGVGSQGVVAPLINPSNPWYEARTRNGLFLDARNFTAGAQIDYHFGDLNLTYIPAWDLFKNSNKNDTGSVYVSGPMNERQVSQELRLANDSDGPLKWVVGVFDYSFHVNWQEFVNGALALNLADQHNTSYAGFGQATYSVTPALRVTVGGRYSSDEKQALGRVPVAGVLTGFSASHTWGHADYKLGVDYDLTDKSLLYATVQTGYVAGAYSNFPNTATFNNLIAPETLKAYTIGSKNRFFNNKLEVNNEFFYYSYHNYQVTARNATLGVTTVQSAAKSSIYGDQLDVRFLVTSDDTLHASIGFLHSRFDSFSVGTANYNGFQTVDSPDLTANAGYMHVWDLGEHGSISGGVETHFETSHWIVFTHAPTTHQPGFTKTNLTLTYYTPDEAWSFSGYVDNVENTADAANGAAGAYYIDPPRTYGVRATASF